MQLYKSKGVGETNTGTPRAGGEKELKDFLLIFGRNSGTGIGNGDHREFSIAAQAEDDALRLARICTNNEERMVGSPAAVVAGINERLRPAAEAAGVELLAIDRFAAVDGIANWYDAGMWHHSKHEVHPRAAEMYGEQVARLIAAGRGR